MMNKEVEEAIYELSIQTDKEVIYQDEINGYVSTIQNYIEQLEKEKEQLIDLYTEEHQVRGSISFELFKIEKAFDKACETLTKLTSDCNVYQCPFNREYYDCNFECENPQKWKEWCMRDEE